ncbi:hypothetical protein [Paenibacillus sp. GCM10027626]|uniref:N-acyl amino acid synthase FeeM domain-containing protein n=1 Tax=Paenibacillus sp. GCM10027626 TaxID=3273411 RepID=UPI003626E4CC
MSDHGHYVFSIAQGQLREKAIQLHHHRYEEIGFFKKDEVDPYEPFSIYFAVQSQDQTVVGVTRLINSRLDDLPTMKHFQIYDIERVKLTAYDRSRCAEISAFTKMPAHDVGMGLIRTALQHSLDKGITHWVCCIDERVYKYMHRMFKFPFKVIGEKQVYLGSLTVPCALQLSECLENLKKYRHSLYDFLTRRDSDRKQVSLW